MKSRYSFLSSFEFQKREIELIYYTKLDLLLHAILLGKMFITQPLIEK